VKSVKIDTTLAGGHLLKYANYSAMRV